MFQKTFQNHLLAVHIFHCQFVLNGRPSHALCMSRLTVFNGLLSFDGSIFAFGLSYFHFHFHLLANAFCAAFGRGSFLKSQTATIMPSPAFRTRPCTGTTVNGLVEGRLASGGSRANMLFARLSMNFQLTDVGNSYLPT